MNASSASQAVPFRRSLRFQLSLVIAGVIFLAVMAASATGAWRELNRSAAARAHLLEATASAYAAALSEPLASGDRRAAYALMRGVRDLPTVTYIALKNADGAVFAQLGGGVALRGRDRDLRQLDGLNLLGANAATVSGPILKGGREIGKVVILADVSDLREGLIASLGWTALAALAAILGGVGIAQVMIARLTRPIRDLTAMMADIGARQDFSRQMPATRRKDESAVLGFAFNGMIDNIRVRDLALARHLETLEATVEDRTHDLRLAKEDAEAANAAKSDFLATMSHEIRTPMNGMMVMAEMLAAADLTPRHRRYAEIISRSGASLLTIINDILDLSKIEAGKLDLEAVPFSPDALVEDVAALFWEKARSKDLELAIHIAPDTPDLIIGDPTRFNQVVTNLVNNALKFTERGGVSIYVSARAEGDRSRIEVAVRDTGVGIETSRIASIFEAFSQADQSTTRRFGGTGLGLTVCKRLIDAMDGEIHVDSEPGKGSTFTISVAFAIEHAAKPIADAKGLRVAVAGEGVMARSLWLAFVDTGARARLIASPAHAQAGEIVLATSRALSEAPPPAGSRAICLSDIGDSHADALLRSGAAADIMPLPSGRRAVADLIDRALRNAFRGVDALASGGAQVRPESFTGLAILAVDDNAVNREVLREALITLEVHADFVANGEEAVAAAKSKAYDAIFMDGSMPVMDGFTATKLIREHEAAAGLTRARIIALTAQVHGADAEAWAKAGADQHMTKPFTAARLVEALKVAASSASKDVTLPAAHPGGSEDDRSDRQVPDLAARIDEDAVATMESVGARNGRDVLAKIWKLFLTQAPLGADRLAKLLLADPIDGAELSKQAHALKSMCLSAGAARMAALCEQVETYAKAGGLDIAIDRLSKLPNLLAETRAVMEQRLTARAAPAAKLG